MRGALHHRVVERGPGGHDPALAVVVPGVEVLQLVPVVVQVDACRRRELLGQFGLHPPLVGLERGRHGRRGGRLVPLLTHAVVVVVVAHAADEAVEVDVGIKVRQPR